jgi:hypothetical protein
LSVATTSVVDAHPAMLAHAATTAMTPCMRLDSARRLKRLTDASSCSSVRSE